MDVALRRHCGAHNLFGTGQCRRLAKLVPNMAADNGTAALLNHAFIEWLAAPILFPDDAVLARPLYNTMPSIEQYGKSLERALSKIRGDQPRGPAVLRAQLRRIALADRAAGGTGVLALRCRTSRSPCRVEFNTRSTTLVTHDAGGRYNILQLIAGIKKPLH